MAKVDHDRSEHRQFSHPTKWNTFAPQRPLMISWAWIWLFLEQNKLKLGNTLNILHFSGDRNETIHQRSNHNHASWHRVEMHTYSTGVKRRWAYRVESKGNSYFDKALHFMNFKPSTIWTQQEPHSFSFSLVVAWWVAWIGFMNPLLDLTNRSLLA